MKTAEQLAEKISTALGTDFRAALLYGSAATGDGTRRFSDVNVMVIVSRSDAATLTRIAGPVRDWVAAGNPPPVVLAEGEIARSADVFPIELSDLRDRHRILRGTADWVAGLKIRPADLRHQLEYELRSKLVLLRQLWLASAGRAKDEEKALARALSSAGALFRASLRLVDQSAALGTVEAARALQKSVNVDAPAWEAVWRLRQGEKLGRDEAPALFARLLAGFESLAQFVDAHAAS